MLGLKDLRYFCFRKNRFEIDQRLAFNKNKNLTKIYFAVEILGRCLLTVKRHFQMHNLRLSFALGLKTLRFFLLLLGDIKAQNKKTYKGIFSRTSEMSFLFMVHIT